MRRPRYKLCAFCGSDAGLVQVEGGWSCSSCLKRGLAGRDESTQLVRSGGAPSSLEGPSATTDSMDAMPIQDLVMGEAVSAATASILDTLKDPDQAALDASSHRVDLVTRLGNDVTALALDASHTIRAENSLEKMLAHQMAVAHKVALETTDKAFFEADPLERARLLNVAARYMETFQKGLLVIQKLRTGGEQTIHVQHVHVSEGGQAIVGTVQAGVKPK